MTVRFLVDGQPREWSGDPDARLLGLLREQPEAASPKPGCEIGRCGACLVLVDGDAVPSCLVLAARLDGAQVQTAAGLGLEGRRILQCLAEQGAIQCGYCSAGIVVAIAGALREQPLPAADEVLARLDGQLCRCGGYEGLRRAVRQLFGGSAVR